MSWAILLQGLLIGILVAAPIGPIGVLCMRASVISGFAAGFATGLGAAVVDGLFGLIAALFFNLINQQIEAHQMSIGLSGGAFVLAIAYVLWRQPPPQIGDAPPPARLWAAFMTSLGLTLVNPMTMMGFVAVFGGLGLGRAAATPAGVALLTISVFLGSALWWLFLAGLVSRLRHHLSGALAKRINQGTALLTAALGVVSLVRPFWP